MSELAATRTELGPRLRTLLRGNSVVIGGWIDRVDARWLATCVAVIVVGAGLYGATLGLWRSPEQAVYTALKFPLLILLTTAGNALLNGVLAQLLGTGLSFRQTSLAIVLSFTLAAVILAALSPLTLFLWLNTPAIDTGRATVERGISHDVMQLTHILTITFAGVVANVRLLRLIERFSPARGTALRTLFAWLAGNLLLGSQIAWVLRPFVGTPGVPVEFLRADAMRGNFFESVYQSLVHLLSH